MPDNKKIALVTGGVGGIGTEICRKLYEQGRKVVAGCLPSEEDIALAWQQTQSEMGFEFELAAGDVSLYESAAGMIRKVVEQFGSIDILVNCAGITRDSTLRKMSEDDWSAVLTTNLYSLYNVSQQVVDPMVSGGFGRIVNISSVNGQKGQFGQTNYSAAKAGVHGFTMALAQELAKKGVTVNTVSPGYVKTSLTDLIPEKIRDSIVSDIPVGRMAHPEEIGHAVAFLCANESAYITGANLPVNGGHFMSF